ncbi:MAG: Uma2 family endonuclease [Okeania sp. SIO3B5]|uniref:Uma2 family endonuclease n=1 Tax=Okeania sp. SIO3B5 TaxID=2607811 RepID=UPI00140184AB|nr:Uma2 family endonuclease [Okeania sp. SIO3B5]NEO52682.1 Uma2 family endonuclease [Okeania sp. SIO3B5]
MIAQLQNQPMTSQEYLEWEEQQPIKYEYVNGKVYAMTGGSLGHNSIALNLASALKNHLRGKGCKVFMADAKAGISEKGPFYYPDVMVTCDDRDLSARQIVYHPCLIIEVLSPGTANFDQGRKFRNYRRIDTLKEYVLIEAETMNVESYHLNDKGKWELTSYSTEEPTTNQTDQNVHFTSVNFQCLLSSIYQDVIFPESN